MSDDKLSENAANFSAALFKRLATENPGKNLFFSPASISVALGMTLAGSDGNTKLELLKNVFGGN